MVEKVTSHRRAVRDETGKTTEVENAVKAENITHAGDLPETAQVVNSGEAVMVNVDGTLRRTTLEALLLWLQNNIQSGISFNIPYVDATTKHWMRYDPSTGQYEDTGVVGEGVDGEDGTNSYQYAVAGGYAGTEDEFSSFMAAIVQQQAERYRIEIPGKNGVGKSVVLWNSGDGNLRIDLRYGSGAGTVAEMVVSVDQESGQLQIGGVHTGDGDGFVASRGFVEDAIQTAITGAIGGAY